MLSPSGAMQEKNTDNGVWMYVSTVYTYMCLCVRLPLKSFVEMSCTDIVPLPEHRIYKTKFSTQYIPYYIQEYYILLNSAIPSDDF